MERLAAQVRRLVRATEAYRRLVAEVLGIGVTEANTLAELWYSGSLTPSVLAERLGLTSPSVTAVVDRLEVTGLIARRRHPVDRRSVFVELTETGLEELRAMVEMFGGDVLSGVRDAAPEHILELDRMLGQVATTLETRTAERSGIAASLA
jgi:DNA-binding MarR family transcriptional regulator